MSNPTFQEWLKQQNQDAQKPQNTQNAPKTTQVNSGDSNQSISAPSPKTNQASTNSKPTFQEWLNQETATYTPTNTYTQQANAVDTAEQQQADAARAEGFRKRAFDTRDKINELHRQNTGDYSEETQKIMAQIDSAEKQYEFFASEYERLTGKKLVDNFWERAGNTTGGGLKTAVGDTANAVATAGMWGQKQMAEADPNSMAAVAATMLPEANLAHYGINRTEEEQSAAIQNWGDKVYNEGQEQIQDAKYGLGAAGQFAVDAGAELTKIGADAALSLVAPWAGTANMVTRSFGGGAREARADGKDIDTQMALGLAQAGKEYVLNKALGGMTKAYGQSKLGNAASKALERAVKNDTARAVLQRVLNTEGIEEGLSTILDPAIKAAVYDDLSLGDAYSELELEDVLYSAIMGQALGFIGGGEEPSRFQNNPPATSIDTAVGAQTETAKPDTTPQNEKTPLDILMEVAEENALGALDTQGNIQTPPATAEASVAQSDELNLQNTGDARADMPALPAEAPTAPRSKTAEEYDAETEELFEMLLAKGEPPASNRVKPNNDIDSVEIMTGIPANANQEMQQPSAPRIQQGANPQTVNTAVDANGGEYVPTQTNSSDPLYTEEERTVEGLRPEDSVHLRHTDKSVDEEAERRYQADKEGEKADLFAGERTWNDADTRLAYKFLSEAVDEARKTGDYSEVVKLQREWERQGTLEGQALRQRGRFTNTPEEIIAEAATKLEDSPGGTRKLSPQRKTEIMNQVADFAKRYNDIKTGDTASVVDMIKELNVVRKTTGLLSSKTSKQLSKALEQASTYSDGDTFLRDVLVTQIRSVASDYVAPSRIEQAKQVRFTNLLSKLTTLARNFVGNNILDAMEMLSNNQGVALDMLLSKYTGTRSVAVDKGWLSKAKREGAAEGYTKSFIQVALDADIDDVNTKYEQRKGRTFKMTGNPLERFMSTWEKHLAYGLKTSDEMQKGGIRAEAQRGIDELKAKGKIADDALADRANDIALERTLQNDSAVAKAVAGVRKGLDEFAIPDKQGGKLGAGELLVPFARVPANVTAKAVQYSPAGILEGGARLGKVLLDAHNGTLTADQQAKAVQSLGRVMTAAELTVFSTALALKGIIKSEDDEDKDKKAADRARGQRGTQINLSALMRWVSGGSTDWQDSDVLMDVGFAEQLNGILTMGVALSDAYQEDGTLTVKDIAKANGEAVVKAVSELPALSSFANIADSINYSDADTGIGKVADAAMGFAVETAGSFVVPNAVRGVAAGTDKYERDSYGGDSAWEQQMNYIKSGIPGLRQTLPKTVDSTGRETSYEDEPFLHFLNNNILPGRITKYEKIEYLDEIDRLMNIGANENAGVGNLYPDRKAPNTVNLGGNNKKYELSEDEKREYQAARAQANEEILNELIKSKLYDGMSDEVKALAVDAAWDFATYSANRAISISTGNAFKADNQYLSALQKPAEYIAANTAYKIAADKEDYSGIDAILDAWDTFDRTTKSVLLEKTDIDDFVLAAEGGVAAETYATVKEAATKNNRVSQGRLGDALNGLDDNTADVLWEIWRDKYNWSKSWDEYKRSKK